MLERTTLSALLGPTNTGKTHRAVERMLDHDTGMMGLPLRLLAREVYDRVTGRIGQSEVALITGEEKRVPPRARYFICTVEAMPMDLEVDFLAVDEIQLAAHRQRGHVFTDRLLNARGRLETWFLGADTMRPLIQSLLPHAEVRRHPRLSNLRWSGSTGLGQLPPRSAVVAFSMSRVYEIAERIRRRRGGAAVVLGALSPRARNAQVAMYQAGEVDHMVATDAIGMGLNLDLEHVAFADLSKFDGRESRALEPAELAQIAGRAGRYHTDGTFGTLQPLPPLPFEVVRRIERHEFAPEQKLVWRSSDLDYSSLSALIESLRTPPRSPKLGLVERADDFSALLALSERDEIRERARGEDAVRLLWDACQIPDYRQLLAESHERLVGDVFLELSGPRGRLENDWLASHVKRLDDTSGDIDTLLMRMAFVRTWTYVSSHSSWVRDAGHWQAVTREIEDRLSDALHDRLVERFVDRKKSGRSTPNRVGGRDRARRIAAEGPFAALLELREAMSPDAPPSTDDVESMVDAPHERFSLDAAGRVLDGDRVVGVLTRGTDVTRPEVRVVLEAGGAGATSQLQRRLVAWARDMVLELFAPLRAAPDSLSAAGRGLLYQLEQGLGTIRADVAQEQIAHLTADDRSRLEELGVRIGRRVVFVPALSKPRAVDHRAALWTAFTGQPVVPPRPGAVSLPADEAGPGPQGWLALGYVRLGPRAVRADAVERALDQLSSGAPDQPTRKLMSRWLGCPEAQLEPVLRALGPTRKRRRRRRPQRRRRDGAPETS